MRPAFILAAVLSLAVGSAHASPSRAVFVEFQAASDDDAGIAYLLYSMISESLIEGAGDRIAAGEDVEMYLGSSAVTCREKQSCLDKIAEEFDASAAVFATISRSGTDINVSFEFVSCATGRVLDSADVTYEAGDEGQLAQELLGRLDDNLAAAESQEEDSYADEAPVPVDDDVDWDEDEPDFDPAPDEEESPPTDTPVEERSAVSVEPPPAEDDWRSEEEEEPEDDWRSEEEPTDDWRSEEEAEDDWRSEEEEDDDWRSEEAERDWGEDTEKEASEEQGEQESPTGGFVIHQTTTSEPADTGDDYSRGYTSTDTTSDATTDVASETRGRGRRRNKEPETTETGEAETQSSTSSRYSARDYLRDEPKQTRRTRERREEEEEEPTSSSRYSRSSSEDERAPTRSDERTRRGSRRPRHPEDHETATTSGGRDIDPDLLETFDDEDMALFDETGRSGTGTLTYQEASEKGMGPSEYRRYSSSGLTLETWRHERYNHRGKFHLRFGGFYALGGLDSYYSARVVMWDETDVLETYYWQSFGFSALGGGGTIGLGMGVAPAVDLGLDVSILVGKQWLLRQYRTPDDSESTIENVDPADIPKGTAVSLMVDPKVRIYFAPFKAVKPYGGFGLAMMFLPPFDVPEEWVPDRSTTFVLGLEPTLGIQFDSALGFGFFIEVPFTGYVATNNGIESGHEGEQHVLLDDEKNDPPEPVPRYMLRVQLGLQVRM